MNANLISVVCFDGRIDSLEKFHERIPFMRSELKDERMYNSVKYEEFCHEQTSKISFWFSWRGFIICICSEIVPFRRYLFMCLLTLSFLWLSRKVSWDIQLCFWLGKRKGTHISSRTSTCLAYTCSLHN